MHVIGLRLKNVARFRGEHELSPLEAKPYAIVARAEEDDARSNWLGKSTLPVALRYALFGVLPDQYETLDDLISDGEDDMAVDVELSDGSFVSRERRRRQWTKLMYVDPAGLQSNQDVAQQKIVALLGLDLDTYDIVADIAQKKSDRFTTMKSGPLTELVQSWVGLERLVEAESLAAKDLAQLSKELGFLDAEMSKLVWATEDEGRLRAIAVKAAKAAHAAAVLAAESINRLRVAYHEHRRHDARWVQAESLRGARDELAQVIANAVVPKGVEIKAAQALADTARTAEQLLNREVQSLSGVARGAFDGACPVLPGFECPARTTINDRRAESSAALALKRTELHQAATERSRLQEATDEKIQQFDEATNRNGRLRVLDSKLEGYADSLAYIAEHGHLPEGEPPVAALVDSTPITLAEQARQQWNDARVDLASYESRRPVLAARVAAYRVAVLALELAQRRLCEGAVQRVEAGANRRLSAAGVDLSVEWRWGRETNKLATRCGQCGAEFPTTAKVKSCQVCQAPRGFRVEPKMHVRLSDRSGAADDLAGVAISFAARDWLVRRRAADWGTVCLDEPFASLDLANRRALSGHLNRLVSDGVAQSFVIAHDRQVLESLPGRIEVIGRGAWSEVRVVA